MANQEEQKLHKLEIATACAMSTLPVLARLKFVKSIILMRGGDRDDAQHDAALVTAGDILEGVIDVLKKHPKAARLRTPEA